MKDEIGSISETLSDMEITKKNKISRKRRLHQIEEDEDEVVDEQNFGAFTEQSPAKKGIQNYFEKSAGSS